MRHFAPAVLVHDFVCLCQHIARFGLMILDVLPLICRHSYHTYAIVGHVAHEHTIHIYTIYACKFYDNRYLSILSNWLLLFDKKKSIEQSYQDSRDKVHIPAKLVSRRIKQTITVLRLFEEFYHSLLSSVNM